MRHKHCLLNKFVADLTHPTGHNKCNLKISAAKLKKSVAIVNLLYERSCQNQKI